MAEAAGTRVAESPPQPEVERIPTGADGRE